MAANCMFLRQLPAQEAAAKPVAGDLEKDFVTPPDWAKPSGYWWWFYNLADKEGITRDLTEFKAKGMGSVMIVCTAHVGQHVGTCGFCCQRLAGAGTPCPAATKKRQHLRFPDIEVALPGDVCRELSLVSPA